MSDHFICSICGERHEGLVTDWAYSLPDVVWEIPEAERAVRARFTNDLCQFGERYFIRCVLGVPLNDSDGEFGWGAWSEVEWPVFERYLEMYEEDGAAEPVHRGTLANRLPAYEASLGKPVLIQFRDPTKRPSLSLPKDDESQLADEQRNGIDNARHHEIIDIIHRIRACVGGAP